MSEWNVEHMREPENGLCPVCGDRYARAVECYPEAETTIPSGRHTRACVIAGVASASPDLDAESADSGANSSDDESDTPTLIRIDHHV